jgi:5-methylcytosine-specific restriction endonuclease McrA
MKAKNVFVLSKNKKPLMSCTEQRAWRLIRSGKAVINRKIPFTIRLLQRLDGDTQPVEIKIDPGSKCTGVALDRVVTSLKTTGIGGKEIEALLLAQLNHRGKQISDNLTKRAGYRKGRRSRNLRYRKPRFNNRVSTKKKGWLAPSLKHRVDSTENLVIKLSKLIPITKIYVESVKFDVQRMEDPNIWGKGYQQGTLHGYTIREHLLNKWGRKCAYCGKKGRLEVDHIHPKSKGGSDRIDNLTLACRECNQAKDNQLPEVWLDDRPTLLKKIQEKAVTDYKDAAAVNTTNKALIERLKTLAKKLGIAGADYDGVQTSRNRSKLGIPKDHCLDALCVGKVKKISGWEDMEVLHIDCTGRGQYRRTNVDSNGFPRSYLPRTKQFFGFATGDIVKAVIPKGKTAGTYVGRITVRTTGSFWMRTKEGTIVSPNHKNCTLLQRNDGYSYSWKPINTTGRS